MRKILKNNKSIVASLMLMLTAFLWGTTFVAQSKGLEQIGHFTFLAFRSYCAVIFLTPVAVVVMKNNRKKYGLGKHNENKTFFSKNLIIGGVLCGAAVFLGSFTQQIGITLSGVGKSGFLTTLYILMVPLLGLLFKKKVTPTLWISIGIATVGMYFLCVTEVGRITKGDLLLILCAFIFAVQILIVDHFIEIVDGVRLSLMQLITTAVIATVGMLIFEDVSLEALKNAAFSIFYAGVLSSGVAYTLQIVAQKNLQPTIASLIMSLESVFAALAGAVFGERLTPNEILGCVLVFISIILAQIPVGELLKSKKKNKLT